MSTQRTEISPQTDAAIRETLAPRLAAAKTRQAKSRETASLLFFTYGIYPSAALVRGYTQHGSATDINNDLRDFWHELREKTRVRIEAPMLPDELAAVFSEALGNVWEVAVAKADATLDAERQEAAAAVAEARREAEEDRRRRRDAEDRIEASEAELRQERSRREEAEKRVEAQGAEIAVLQSSLATWQQQAETEAKARQEAEERFSRDLEAERTANQRNIEMLDGEVKFAKMQIEAARSTERDLRDQLKEEKATKEAALTSYRQRANRAEEALGAARLELAELKGRNEGLEGRLSELQARVKSMTKGVGRGTAKSTVKRRSLRR